MHAALVALLLVFASQAQVSNDRLKRLRAIFFLILAILFEVAGTMLLPVAQNSTKVTPTVGLIFAYTLSFYFLTFDLQAIPIGIVYATWTGLGIFLIAILGNVFFDETLS